MRNTFGIGGVPLWAWVLVGWLGAGTVAAFVGRDALSHTLGGSKVVREALDQGKIEWELDEMSPREMRTLPAIGSSRAMDVADARWEASLPRDRAEPQRNQHTDLQAVRGIGPKTEQNVQRFLRDRRGPSLVPPVVNPMVPLPPLRRSGRGQMQM